ncbi:ribosome maturation factor RimM [Leptolyngbya sp. 'hensonii']|uniref:ribosome maturation factor RimM n=1 Tax=Leptolyngbya sp. 'hensonii' TaxID=1922337 RepID=UPI00094FE090|nr:ribosome maturation factor RimM [Leptolyngbya sp. 'hensonii']OLP17107.1 ribosome maturation factor RimM [Leptolyngbya sp. 'hensonii']
MTYSKAGWLEIGKIVAAQGLKGEVRIYPDSDFPERFEDPGRRWLLKPGDTEPQPVELLKGRLIQGKGLYVLQFAGVTDRDQAEALRGSRLLVPDTDRPPLEEDEFHVMDLIGLPVFHQVEQIQIGEVVDVFTAGNDLLEVQLSQLESDDAGTDPDTTSVKQKRTTVLIPFVKAIVPIVDLKHRRIEILPPAGLLDL